MPQTLPEAVTALAAAQRRYKDVQEAYRLSQAPLDSEMQRALRSALGSASDAREQAILTVLYVAGAVES